MFQFPGFAPLSGTPYGVGCPIRKFTDQSLFAAPHDLSQRITSFIASCRQGIHRMPLRHLITLIINVHLDVLEARLDDPSCATAHIPFASPRPVGLRGSRAGYLSASAPKNLRTDHTNDHPGLQSTSQSPEYLLHPRANRLLHRPVID